MQPVENRLNDRANRISSTASKVVKRDLSLQLLCYITHHSLCQYFFMNLYTYFDKYIHNFMFIPAHDWRINIPKTKITSPAGIYIPLSVPRSAHIKHHIC